MIWLRRRRIRRGANWDLQLQAPQTNKQKEIAIIAIFSEREQKQKIAAKNIRKKNSFQSLDFIFVVFRCLNNEQQNFIYLFTIK